MQEDIDVLLAEHVITRVLTTCSRGVDRFDFDAVRGLPSPDDIGHRILDRSRG
jgi:hypothetical protein